MKNWRGFILGLALCIKCTFAAPQVIDRIAAVVDDGVILESDVKNLLITAIHHAQKINQPLLDNAFLRRQLLEHLIIENIMLQLAQRANIAISDEQVDLCIHNIIAQNHITFEELRSRLAYERKDYDIYRMEIRKEMLIAKVRNSEVSRRINILPWEVDSLAQQIFAKIGNDKEFKLSQILISLPEKPTQKQLDKAKALSMTVVKQIRSGVDFGKLAITYSNDPYALKGIEIGWKKIEQLPSLFLKKLQGAQKGSIIGPIRSDVGFHILKVNEIRSSDKKVMITEVHVRHILLRSSVMMSDHQAYTQLENIAAQIKSGLISFQDAAKQMSEDPDSVHQGGDLGWSPPDSFHPNFRDALFHLKKGEMSPPVHSSFGWHLIQLIDTKQIDRTDAAKKNHAYQMLFNRKFAKEAEIWMQERRASAYVKIF
ncbi:MAG: peptidylprolyl isomerase SurA [Sodalis sp. (in: enterobacteria)]